MAYNIFRLEAENADGATLETRFVFIPFLLKYFKFKTYFFLFATA